MTEAPGRGPIRALALGGGHGLAASLEALRLLTDQLTAVVTVADDGGSSGRLRTELGALPPGDLRMALTALAGRDGDAPTWARLFQHRFPGAGPLAGHAVGNLVLTALTEVTGSAVTALELAGTLLGATGRVLPLTLDNIDILAHVAGADPARPDGVTEVRGQVAVATTTGRVCAVRLVPDAPAATPEAVEAILAADLVVLGPGSLFTSVIPHLLVPEIRKALIETRARRVFALNLAPQPGETSGFSPEAHLEALVAHAPDLGLDVVVADTTVLDRDGLMVAASALGATVHFGPVAASAQRARHDPPGLARAYAAVLGVPGPDEGSAAGWR